MSVNYVVNSAEEVKEPSAHKMLSGVFYRRSDGVEFPFSNPCYVIGLDENGMPTRLAFYKDGFQNESYILEDHNRAVYLAAVSQGFEPPRGLLRRDRPAR